MKIVIGNDHSAVAMRQVISQHLKDRGFEVEEVGTFSEESSNYPEWGEKVARKVVAGDAPLGIAICGTGIGISIACNKVKGIRAACCSDPYSAKLSRQHNNSNVLCFGARVVGTEVAKMIVDEWLDAEFLGGRHQNRIDMIAAIEKEG